MPTYPQMRAQPPFRERLVDKDGRLTRPWLAWFQGQFKKLGGLTDTAPISIDGEAATAVNAQTALTAATAQDATSAAYVYTPANALTGQDRGASLGGRIVVAGTVFDWVDLKNVSYNGVSLIKDDAGADLAYSTQYFVYCDDPSRTGGAVTWKATTDYLKLNNVGRWHLGAVVTPADAGGDTAGGGDGGGGGLGRIEKYGF